jgi:spore germination protein GerM
VRRLLLAMLLGAALALLIGWTWFGGLFRWTSAPPQAAPTPSAVIAPPAASPAAAAAADAPDARKIRATLFYVAENGVQLVPVDREVGYADETSEQARLLLEALIKPVEAPMASAIPAGVTLKTVLLSEKGDAFVDFSPELSTNHTGGSLDELLTVYAIVDTLTVNLPAIARVQILIDGKEADTLAGHIDLRRPLAKNLTWTRPPENAPGTNGAPAAPPADPRP